MTRTLLCGTPAHYAAGCRLAPCRRAQALEAKRGRLRRLQGIRGVVPTETTQQHIRKMLDAGSSITRISADAATTPGTVSMILHGQRTRIRRGTAERILALPIGADPKARIDATGTIRRLRALVALGHFQEVIAASSGLAYTHISMLTHASEGRTVTVATAQGVKSAYSRLSMTPGKSVYSRNNALRRGWYPPLAWDDEAIDDPDASPAVDTEKAAPSTDANAVDRYLHGESLVLEDVSRRRVIAHYMEWTDRTPAEIAAELGMTPDGVSRSWERTKRAARDAGTAVPWRRTYIPRRERGLTYTEMEKAA